MASCLNHITTFLFLLFVFALTAPTLHVHARDSKFFSKVTNHIGMSLKTIGADLGVPVATPEPAPVPASSPVSAVEGIVYNSGAHGVPSAREMDPTDGTSFDEFGGRVPGEELMGGSINTGYGYGGAFSNEVNYKGKADAGLSAHGSTSGEVYPAAESQQGMSDTRYLETSAHGGEVYTAAESQQGMSDTRYLENGRYSYNLGGERSYGNTYEQEAEKDEGNAYVLNKSSSDGYEFDTMEEYYKKRGIADPQDQGVYVP